MFSIKGNKGSVGTMILVPAGWTVSAGTSNSPSLTNWNNVWNIADGVSAGWPQNCTATGDGYPNTVCYALNFANSAWDSGNMDTADDDGSSTNPGDRDLVANRMGTDATVNIPAGTAPGTYTVIVSGVGHDANSRKSKSQTITVTVPDSAAPTVTAFTMPATASSLTVSVTSFTATDNASVTGYKITESATAPLAGDAGWTSSAPSSFTFSSSGTKTAYAWAKDAAGNVSVSRSATVTIAIKQDQTITVTIPAPSSAPYNSQFTVAATASSGLPVSYSSGSTGICTNVGATFTMGSGTGTCIIRYDQAGNATYNAAPQQTNSVTAAKISQGAVSVSAPPSAVFNQAGLFASASGGSGSGAYSYSAGSSTACSVNATTGALTISSGSGSCDITATKAADSNYTVSAPSSPAATVAVGKATPTITAWPTAGTITYGQSLALSPLSGGTASTPGTFAFADPSTIPNAGTAPQNVTFTPADTNNYVTVTGPVSVSVDKANQTITFGALANMTYGDAPFSLSATGGASGNPVTFTSSNPAVATVSGTTVTIVGAGITTITASQAGTANYNAAGDVFQPLTVDKASQTIIFDPLPQKNVGDADFAPGATASSTLTVTYASSNTAVATIVGGLIHIVGPGSADITASQAGNSDYNPAPDVVQPLTVAAAGNPTLSVTIVGNGSVNSTPTGINCTSGTCSADFASGQPVDLLATTSWNHVFTGWSGACSGNASTCTVTVSGQTDVTATFTPKQLVKIGESYYASMQDAYNNAVDGATLQGRDQILTEDLLFGRAVNVVFNGGNDANWTVTGYTTIDGTVTIGGSTGGVEIRNMIIQ